jgi:hypothetical protein
LIGRFDLDFNHGRRPPIVFNLELFEIRLDHVNVIQHSLETDGEGEVQLEKRPIDVHVAGLFEPIGLCGYANESFSCRVGWWWLDLARDLTLIVFDNVHEILADIVEILVIATALLGVLLFFLRGRRI